MKTDQNDLLSRDALNDQTSADAAPVAPVPVMPVSAVAVAVGDIVLFHRPNADMRFPDRPNWTLCPAIVCRVVDQDHVTLVALDPTLGGAGVAGVSVPALRGTQAGEWEPKP